MNCYINKTPWDETQKLIDKLVYIRCFLEDIEKLTPSLKEHFMLARCELKSIADELETVLGDYT